MFSDLEDFALDKILLLLVTDYDPDKYFRRAAQRVNANFRMVNVWEVFDAEEKAV